MKLPIVILSASLLLLGACRSSKPQTESPATGSPSAVVRAGATATEAAFNQITASYLPWQDVTLNLRVKVAKPADMSLSAKVYMRRGEWISMSVRMLGFEVASLWADSDTIFAVTKVLKRQYVCAPTRALLGTAGATIADLQDLLLGRAFLLGSGTLTPSDFPQLQTQYSQELGQTVLAPKEQPANFDYAYLMDDDDAQLAALMLSFGDAEGIVSYNAFQNTAANGLFAGVADIQARRQSMALEAQLTWDLRGARWDTGVRRSFTRPNASYQQIPLSALLKLATDHGASR